MIMRAPAPHPGATPHGGDMGARMVKIFGFAQTTPVYVLNYQTKWTWAESSPHYVNERFSQYASRALHSLSRRSMAGYSLVICYGILYSSMNRTTESLLTAGWGSVAYPSIVLFVVIRQGVIHSFPNANVVASSCRSDYDDFKKLVLFLQIWREISIVSCKM